MTRIIAAIGIAILLGIGGCERATPAAPQASGAKANCIVCGNHELDVTADTFFSDFGGKKYYFCSKECKSDFDKDPQKYLAKAPAASGTTVPSVQ